MIIKVFDRDTGELVNKYDDIVKITDISIDSNDLMGFIRFIWKYDENILGIWIDLNIDRITIE